MKRTEWLDLSDYLRNHTITSSTPCRVDCGGSTDHRLTAMLCRHFNPATANISLDLRTTVRLAPYKTGSVLVEVAEIGECEAQLPHIAVSGRFGLLFAILLHFGVQGVRVTITSQLPLQSGLGGSGAVCVALIGAISRVLSDLGRETITPANIALLAHNIEDSLYGNTGLQDQLASAYGGANLWEWEYGSDLSFRADPLLADPTLLAKHIVLAYTGKPHASSQQGSPILQALRRTQNYDGITLLAEVSDNARRFAESVRKKDFDSAGKALQAESILRTRLAPDLLDGQDNSLSEIAQVAGCGAKYSGYGSGGCVWALGSESAIMEIRKKWQKVFHQRGYGYMLPVGIATSGLQISASLGYSKITQS